jgi:RsiW-degrading membrane proteinase PrsW (M82 family)
MRRIWIVLFVLALLALDWVTLHDILKGEPDGWLEWSFIIGGVLLLLAFAVRKTAIIPFEAGP